MCYDTTNNVSVQDFVIPFNNVWYHMKLPIKSFKVYRARRYWGGQDDVSAELFPPELEILEVFMWKNRLKCVGEVCGGILNSQVLPSTAFQINVRTTLRFQIKITEFLIPRIKSSY